MMAMEFFETTGWLSGAFGPWLFRHQYIETLYNIFQLIMYLILLLIGMIWIEVRAQFERDGLRQQECRSDPIARRVLYDRSQKPRSPSRVSSRSTD